MSTAATQAIRKDLPARSKETRPANALDRCTIRVIEEAAMVGCGAEVRRAMIAEAAYYRAERRGFESGHELEDWLAAEADIQSLWMRAYDEAPLHCGE
jgi:hypothetical protein